MFDDVAVYLCCSRKHKRIERHRVYENTEYLSIWFLKYTHTHTHCSGIPGVYVLVLVFVRPFVCPPMDSTYIYIIFIYCVVRCDAIRYETICDTVCVYYTYTRGEMHTLHKTTQRAQMKNLYTHIYLYLFQSATQEIGVV